MNKEKKTYYLGLDIGTESVGYAVTNETYDLMKFRGEPVWGTTTFEAAALAEARRMNRGARRRKLADGERFPHAEAHIAGEYKRIAELKMIVNRRGEARPRTLAPGGA